MANAAEKPTTATNKPTLKDFKELLARVEAAEIKVKKYEDEGMETLVDTQRQQESEYQYRPVGGTNSDEQQAMRYFRCGSVKELLNVNTANPEYAWVPKHLKLLVIQLKKDFTTARFISQIFYGAPRDRVGTTEEQDKFSRCKSILSSYYGKHILAPRIKAFGTGVSGGGAEWIPTAIASTYIGEVELERELVSALRQIDMPTSPYETPTAGGYTKARRLDENTTATVSSFTTGKITLTARKFVEYYEMPEELQEDSAPGIVELGRVELGNAHQRAYEACCINGTRVGTTHIDSDTHAGASSLAEKQWHGFRKRAIDNTANGSTVDFGNAAISDANLRLMRSRMGILGVMPSDLIYVVGAVGYLQMLGTTNVVTVDKMGPNATILRGQLGSYAGTPIVQSGYVRQDLNATGVYDGVTDDRTGLLLVHKNRWYFGTRRPIRMALRPSRSADDRLEIASYSRVDFGAHPQTATEIGVVYGLNVPA